MELYKSPPPPPSSHSRNLHSPPPSPPPQLPPDISSIDEVLSVLVKHHQTHSLSPPPENPPPPPPLLLDTSPTYEVRRVLFNQHAPHSLSPPPENPPPMPPLPPDTSPTDEVRSVLVNQNKSHLLSLPLTPPLPPPQSPPAISPTDEVFCVPIRFDYLSGGDIKKCAISEFSSPADSLIGKFSEISIIDGDHIPEFTGSVTVSNGVVVDDISIIDGDHFPKFTGSVVSKGVADNEEPIHASEDDSDEADYEGSDSCDGDDKGSDPGDGDDTKGVEDDQLGGNGDPNKSNGSDGSLTSSVDSEGKPKKYAKFYGIYLRNNPMLLAKLYDYQFGNLETFQEWEECVRKRVAKLKVEGLPEHYEVVFEREISQTEQESKFAYLSPDGWPNPSLSRIVLIPERRYDIYLKRGIITRWIGTISKAECAAMGSMEELKEHLEKMVYKMKLEDGLVNHVLVWFEYAIADEQKEYLFVEIPKDLTGLFRLLSRIVIDVCSVKPNSPPSKACGSGTKRLNEASLNEASGSGTKRTTTDMHHQF